jgi:hypothetical protein
MEGPNAPALGPSTVYRNAMKDPLQFRHFGNDDYDGRPLGKCRHDMRCICKTSHIIFALMS